MEREKIEASGLFSYVQNSSVGDFQQDLGEKPSMVRYKHSCARQIGSLSFDATQNTAEEKSISTDAMLITEQDTQIARKEKTKIIFLIAKNRPIEEIIRYKTTVSYMKLVFAALALSTTLLSAEPTYTQPLPNVDLPTPQFQPPAPKSPVLAATLSSLMPGLGHVYLGDMQTAGSLFGSAYLGIGLGFVDQLPEEARTFSLLTAQNIAFYGAYAAYRDARLMIGNSGYAYKMPTDSLASLSFAPFKPSIMKKPEVWGGILGALTLASIVGRIAFPEEARIKTPASSRGSYMPALALPVGVGEEAFFRGYLQPALSEPLTPWGGIALSSLAFAAVHIPNAEALEPEHRWRYYSFSLPLIATLGSYFGYLTYKNTSLQESVAVHTWYDLVIFTSVALAGEAAITGNTSFSISLPF